jgi:hypothetical protein
MAGCDSAPRGLCRIAFSRCRVFWRASGWWGVFARFMVASVSGAIDVLFGMNVGLSSSRRAILGLLAQ